MPVLVMRLLILKSVSNVNWKIIKSWISLIVLQITKTLILLNSFFDTEKIYLGSLNVLIENLIQTGLHIIIFTTMLFTEPVHLD